jgi:hypothetical protein
MSAQALDARTRAAIDRRKAGGYGSHDTRPRGQRDRKGAKAAAIRDQQR